MIEEGDDAGGSGPTERPSDSAAMHFALSSAAGSAEARAFLQRQGEVAAQQARLIALQADQLHEEMQLNLSHLKHRRFTDYTKAVFEIAVGLVVVLVVCGLGTMVWSASRDRDIVFDAFSVPPDVAQTGMTGTVLANRLLDRFGRMQAEPGVTETAASGRRDGGEETRVEIPDTGISLGELARYLRAWLGQEVHVTGDLVRADKGFALTVRYGSQPGVTTQGTPDDLDSLIQISAEHVFSAARPYRFVDYLVHKQRYAEASRLIPPLAARGTSEERALAYAAWAETEFYSGDMPGALEKGREAVRLNPDNPLTRFWLGATEGNLGHDEENRSNFAEGLRLADEKGTDTLGEAVKALIPAFGAYAVEPTGDFSLAARDYELARPADFWTSNLGNEIFDAAAAHDIASARALIPLTPDKQRNKPNIDVKLAPFYIAINTQDWVSAARAGAAVDSMYASRPDLQWQRRYSLWPQWAYTMAMKGDMPDAQALIAKTAADCDTCMRMRGRIAAQAHDFANAGRDFAVVAARSPHEPFAETDWGEMLLHKGDIDGAIAKFEQAHAKGPHFADPLEMWGEALMAKNRSDLALAKFEEANKYAPNWGRLHLKWGEALMYAGSKDEAQKQFATASRLDLSAADSAALARLGAKHD
jgi:tetratricopeptide (TPR) repeat protein